MQDKDERILFLENRVTQLEAENEMLQELEAENKQLKERLAQLEDQLKQVKQLIWKPDKQDQKPGKTGPKNGHEPHNRPTPDKIHRHETLTLDKCPDCGNPLPTRPVRTRKRYIESIRPPEPLNTEYEIPHYWCRHCQKQVSPSPPEAIPKSPFSIQLTLFIVFLRYGMILPLNKIRTLLNTCFGTHISEGAIVNAITRFAEYAGPEYDKIRKEVRHLTSIHVDETGWRLDGQNHWLWDFITTQHTLLVIDKTRSAAVPERVLGPNPDRTITCDCYTSYDKIGGKQQKCWAHILRNSEKLKGDGTTIHYKLKKLHKKALKHTGKPEAQTVKKQLETQIERLQLIPLTDKKTRAMIKTITKHKENLFRFMIEENVEHTNNPAERGLRHSVVMRKITGGNRSPKGARNHEVIMSVMGTWEKQGLDFFEEGLNMIQNLP